MSRPAAGVHLEDVLNTISGGTAPAEGIARAIEGLQAVRGSVSAGSSEGPRRSYHASTWRVHEELCFVPHPGTAPCSVATRIIWSSRAKPVQVGATRDRRG